MSGQPPVTKPVDVAHLWREGALHRVLTGAAVGFIGGVSYASFRSLPPSVAIRAGTACGLFAAPFFALREVVAAGAGVDGPVASAVAGGFAGYFGALFVSGPHWKAVSHGAMVVGVTCGFADVVLSGLDWRRKVYLVNRHDSVVAAVSASTDNGDKATHVVQIRTDGAEPPSWMKWPVWFPVFKELDEEYDELLRRQRATVVALEEEQARIALLLEALESVKAGRPVRDAELAEGDRRLDGRNDQLRREE